MRIITLSKLLIFVFFAINSQNILAQTIDSIHYGWVVYEINEGTDDKKCYVLATPHKKDSSYTSPRKPYLSVTRYERSKIEEISLYSGYEYKMSSDVHLLIGDEQKKLFVKDDIAWAKNRLEDKRIIQAMLRNNLIKARSDSSFGNYAIDEYRLKGFGRAYARMKELCE